jgi:uncharacterized protein
MTQKESSFMNRREFIRNTSIIASTTMLGAAGRAGDADFPVVRVAENKRRFKSAAVERTIAQIKSSIGNKELAWMFENCFPNTLDTTVDFEMIDGRPDTYVITGDIDAMWLRDSSAQVWPYLPLTKEDERLRQLIAGVINFQTRCVLKDPYANAFYKDEKKISDWKSDETEMKPGVHEHKWEVDSLCYTIRLAHGYWKTTGDTSPFDDKWHEAVLRIPKTFREQQRKHGHGPYHFQRNTTTPTDGLPGRGYGNPVNPVGLICSMFRPSDDATIFPFLVPSNFFAVVSLRQAADMLEQIHHDTTSAADSRALATEVEGALLWRIPWDLPVFTRTRWMASGILTASMMATFRACCRSRIWARSQRTNRFTPTHGGMFCHRAILIIAKAKLPKAPAVRMSASI